MSERISCVKCKRDMSGHPPEAPHTWSCSCGITARLMLRSAVDTMLEMGFSYEKIADPEPGKRLVLPFGRLGKDYVIYEEPVEDEP